MMKLLLASLVAVFGVAVVLASGYDELRAASVKKCAAIDAAAAQSGLYFNPDGYRSYYLRSQCFQEAAVSFRDDTLCAQVKQRRALLSSSWGYSATRCRTLVADGIAADRRALEDLRRKHLQGAVTMRDFRIEPNGNSRTSKLFLPSPETMVPAIRSLCHLRLNQARNRSSAPSGYYHATPASAFS